MDVLTSTTNNDLVLISPELIRFQEQYYRCVIGENGLISDKKEGDGCTPRGTFGLLEVYYRSDKIDLSLFASSSRGGQSPFLDSRVKPENDEEGNGDLNPSSSSRGPKARVGDPGKSKVPINLSGNCQIPFHEITPEMGWCDDPASDDYNRLITKPYSYSHEDMWREDTLYDVVIVVDYNIKPVVPGEGSAIFIHIAREGYSPTAGCVALKREDLFHILPLLTPESRLVISI